MTEAAPSGRTRQLPVFHCPYCGVEEQSRTGNRQTAGAAGPACGLHGPPDRDGGAGMTIAVRPTTETATPEVAAAADARFEGITDPVEQALAVLRWA